MSKRSLFVFLSLTIGLIFAFSDVSALLAQETAAEEFTLEEITVTAQKREENQQKVAITMDVISSEEIRELGKNNIDEILSTVSSALIQKAADGYRVSIRGMADDSSSKMGQSMGPPTVAVNTDGVYSNRKDTVSGLYDVERVEVLYGPQSTMYSSNSPGGVINIITAQPKTDKFEVSGSIEVGNYNLLHTEGAVNVPLSDKVALRGSFTTSKRDGYLSNGSDNEDTKSARIRGLYEPSEKLSLTLTGEINKNQGSGFGGGVVPFAYQDEVDDPWTGSEGSMDNVAIQDRTTYKYSGQFILDSFLGALTLTPSYSNGSGERGFVFQGMMQTSTQESQEKGLEFRMTSASDFFFKWIVGGTYYTGWDLNDMQSATSDEYSHREMTNRNRALYANVTYPITKKLRLTAGYRQSWDKMISDNHEYQPDPIIPGQMQLMDQYMIQSNEGKPDYKGGFEFDLAENSMLYGDYATSYRVQGMAGGGGPPGGGGGPPPGGGGGATDSEPTTLKAYTLGIKNRFFENKLQVNASTYYYDYRNYEAMFMRGVWLDNDADGIVEPTDDNGVRDDGETFMEDNAGGTGDGRMIGLDLQTSAIITPEDMLTLSVSYINSEWTTLFFNYTYTWGYTLDENGNRVVEYYGTGDFRGREMMSTPPWTINLNYSHNFPLWNGGTIKASIISKYQTGYSLNWIDEFYPYSWQETHHIETLNAVYNNPTGKWYISAYVNNVFNYAEKRMVMNAGGQINMSIGDPRTYGAVLSVRFD